MGGAKTLKGMCKDVNGRLQHKDIAPIGIFFRAGAFSRFEGKKETRREKEGKEEKKREKEKRFDLGRFL